MKAEVKLFNDNFEVCITDNEGETHSFHFEGGFSDLTEEDVVVFAGKDIEAICNAMDIVTEDIENLDELGSKIEQFYDRYRE